MYPSLKNNVEGRAREENTCVLFSGVKIYFFIHFFNKYLKCTVNICFDFCYVAILHLHHSLTPKVEEKGQ